MPRRKIMKTPSVENDEDGQDVAMEVDLQGCVPEKTAETADKPSKIKRITKQSAIDLHTDFPSGSTLKETESPNEPLHNTANQTAEHQTANTNKVRVIQVIPVTEGEDVVTTGDDVGDGKSQQHSLEALCQAVDSELQSYKSLKPRPPGGDHYKSVSTGDAKSISQVHAYKTQSMGGSSSNGGRSAEGGKTVSKAASVPNPLIHIVEVDRGRDQGEVELQIFLDDDDDTHNEDDEERGASLEVEDHLDQNTVKSEGQLDVFPPYHTKGGRRRKHPEKPGKYKCEYCGRGCAKPSVLEKHLRAHTGERPYPCEPCGLAFKTKSNLYKHCKSRTHSLVLSKSGSSDASMSVSGADLESSIDDDPNEAKIKQEGVRLLAPRVSAAKSLDDKFSQSTLHIEQARVIRAVPVTNASVTSTIEELPDKSMKVTIQLPKPNLSPKTASQNKIPRAHSLDSGIKKMTPEMLQQRISYLISNNQLIVDTPMADPPRPKRQASRQSSASSIGPETQLLQVPSSVNASNLVPILPSRQGIPIGSTLARQLSLPPNIKTVSIAPLDVSPSNDFEPQNTAKSFESSKSFDESVPVKLRKKVLMRQDSVNESGDSFTQPPKNLTVKELLLSKRAYSSSQSMESTLMNQSMDSSACPSIDSSQYVYGCDMCQFQFPSIESLNSHYKDGSCSASQDHPDDPPNQSGVQIQIEDLSDNVESQEEEFENGDVLRGVSLSEGTHQPEEPVIVFVDENGKQLNLVVKQQLPHENRKITALEGLFGEMQDQTKDIKPDVKPSLIPAISITSPSEAGQMSKPSGGQNKPQLKLKIPPPIGFAATPNAINITTTPIGNTFNTRSLGGYSGYTVMTPSGHSTMASSGHIVTTPSGHSAMASSGHSVTTPSGHSVVTPSGHSGMTPSGQSTTPRPEWKEKLKRQLLLKRSMSVERLGTDDKSKATGGANVQSASATDYLYKEELKRQLLLKRSMSVERLGTDDKSKATGGATVQSASATAPSHFMLGVPKVLKRAHSMDTTSLHVKRPRTQASVDNTIFTDVCVKTTKKKKVPTATLR